MLRCVFIKIMVTQPVKVTVKVLIVANIFIIQNV
jgi:hypothetical protein